MRHGRYAGRRINFVPTEVNDKGDRPSRGPGVTSTLSKD